ncbi:MAG TPA: PEGA domain-containing protein [Kofleriaceae bacterium]|nr:PEGA domain-containing protein [Kofleriaceae bacterium]
MAALLAAGILALCAAPARAQDETLNKAREAFDKAQELFSSGNFADAAAKFEEAYATRPFSQFLFNIGACHEKLKAYDKAAEYYRKYVAAEPNAPDRAKTEKRIAALDKAAAEVKAAPPTPPPDPNNPTATPPTPAPTPTAVANLEEIATRGFVVILSEPVGAIIYLDSKKSKPLSKTPWNGPLSGEHTILLEREGYKPAEERIAPDPRQLLVLKIVMGEEDYLGWVDISSNVADASIYIDDRNVPLMQKGRYSGNLPPGKHKVWVTADGYTEFTQEVNVVAAETYKVQANLQGAPVAYLDVRGQDVEKVKIYVDGKVLCERGPCREPVPAGPHTIQVKRGGFKTYTADVDVQSKTQMTLRARLAEEPSRMDAVVMYIVSAAFLGGGIWAGLKANSIEDEIQKDIDAGEPPPDEDDGRFTRGKIYAISADAALGVGGITLLMAVYYTFRDKGAASTGQIEIERLGATSRRERAPLPLVAPRVRVEPQLGPDFAGLGMEVRW